MHSSQFYDTHIDTSVNIIDLGVNVAKTRLLLDGNAVDEVKVTVSFPRKRARFKRWALVNLDARIAPSDLDGTSARVILALVFNADKSLKTKDLSAIVGAPTSCVCRALRKLADKSLVERNGHGLWHISRDLVHYGRWNVPDTQHLPNLAETPG